MSARELPVVEREIDGVRFQITKLPYKPAKAALLLLSRKVLPSLRDALAGADIASGDRARMLGALLPRILGGVADAIGNLTDAELEQLEAVFGEHSAFANGADRDGRERWAPLVEANRADLFGGGRMLLYMKWLYACVEVTFGDFFAALGAKSAPSS